MVARETLRAFAYLRISHDPHRTSLSPDRQSQEIERVAAAKGFRVIEWFEERDRSAYRRSVKRPQYDAMLRRLGEVQALFVWEISRLARRLAVGAELLDRLEDLGVRLVSVSEGDSEETPRIALEVMFSVYAQESRDKSRRVSLAHRYNALTLGRAVSPHRTYGYDYDPDTKTLVIRPDEARIVRLAFDAYLAGAGDTELARMLNDGRLAGAPVPPLRGSAWGTTSVARLLTSPTRAGLVTYKGRIVGDDIPAIIDRETFDAVQAVRASRRRSGRRPSRGEGHLLYGLARCAGCGGPMTVNDAGPWGSYRCTRGYDSGLPCDSRASIGRRFLDAHVTDWFFGEIPRYATRLATERRKLDEEEADTVPVVLRREASRIEAALDRLRDAYAVHSEVSLDSYARGIGELEGQLEVVREKIAAVEETRALRPVLPSRPIEQVWPVMTLAEKRTSLGGLISRVEVSRRPKGTAPDESYVDIVPR